MSGREFGERYGLTPEPCPFCRSTYVFVFHSSSPHVCCETCGANGPIGTGEGGDSNIVVRALDGVMRWNTR